MSTTTIRLSDALKARVAAAAEQSGMTTHGFILEAISEKAEAAERRSDLLRVAEERYAEIVASGRTIPWSEMRGYLEKRAGGGANVRRPRARKIAR